MKRRPTPWNGEPNQPIPVFNVVVEGWIGTLLKSGTFFASHLCSGKLPFRRDYILRDYLEVPEVLCVFGDGFSIGVFL